MYIYFKYDGLIMNFKDMINANPKIWIVIFIIATLVDSTVIIAVVLLEVYWLLYIFMVIGIYGAYLLYNAWNEDERTEKALNEASFDVIRIYLILSVSVALIFFILSSLQLADLYIPGSVLIISAIVIIYLQLILANLNEMRMS